MRANILDAVVFSGDGSGLPESHRYTVRLESGVFDSCDSMPKIDGEED